MPNAESNNKKYRPFLYPAKIRFFRVFFKNPVFDFLTLYIPFFFLEDFWQVPMLNILH